MTKLDLVFERIRELPQEQQDAVVAELEAWLGAPPTSPLNDEQEAELHRRLADKGKRYLSHEDVAAFLEKKYGR